MKKILLTVLSLSLLLGSCLTSPGDLTVTISTKNPNYSYTFECDASDYQEAISIMQLDKPDVMEGTTIDLGECALKCVWSGDCLEIHLKQLGGQYRSYWGDNPQILNIRRRHYDKLKKKLGLAGDINQWDSVCIEVVAHNL